MKLGIAIPLKAKSVAKNWDNVEQSLLKTLTSIKNQKNQNFIAIVVGHDKPSFFDQDDKFSDNIFFKKFTQLAAPLITNDHEHNLNLFELDRCLKIFKGFKRLKQQGITHFFPLDADDLLSNELTKHIEENKKSEAILIKNGYIYYENKKILNKTNQFNLYCGSSMIASVNITTGEDSDDNFEGFLFRKVGHVDMQDYLDSCKIDYFIPEKRLVMYIRDNGDNISRYKKHSLVYRIKRVIKLLFRLKPLTKKIKNNFAIE